MADDHKTSTRKTYFPRFGDYLRACRRNARMTQEEAARQAQDLSQALLALYETGKIADPQPEVLWRLTRLYRVNYSEVIQTLVREKYYSDNVPGALDEARGWLELCEAGLALRDNVTGVAGLAGAQLRSKVSLVRDYDTLDLKGVLDWQMRFPELRDLWLVLPESYLDDEDVHVRKAAVSHLKAGARLWYFVNEEEAQPGEKFHLLKGKLAYEDRDVDRLTVKARVKVVPLTEIERSLFTTGLVIANPHGPGTPAGVRILGDVSHRVAIKLGDEELRAIISRLDGARQRQAAPKKRVPA